MRKKNNKTESDPAVDVQRVVRGRRPVTLHTYIAQDAFENPRWVIIAACEDGSIWQNDRGVWSPIAPIPEVP